MLAALCVLWAMGPARAATTLYSTGFEASEGFDPQFTLAGQGSWQVEGTGGNGLLEEAFPGYGQQAYIGFYPPTDQNDFTSLWKPANYNPVPAGVRIVKFSVLLRFVASTQGGQDDFRWSIYNSDGIRLFSLDFETRSGIISYLLQDMVFRETGWSFDFDPDGIYELAIWMDFSRNHWTAFLNDALLAHALPITQQDSRLTFGDADAVWAVRDLKAPGDNYMIFDEYIVTAEDAEGIPPVLEPLALSEAGFPQVRLLGQAGVRYAIDVTSDFKQWFSLGEDYLGASTHDLILEDTTAEGQPISFYSARIVR